MLMPMHTMIPKTDRPNLREPKPATNSRPLKHLLNPLPRESVVHHRRRRRVVVVVVTTTIAGVHQEIEDEQHAPRLQPSREPPRREVRVVEVVEPEPHGRDVEVAEGRAREGFRVRVGGGAEVALVGDHLVLGETL